MAVSKFRSALLLSSLLLVQPSTFAQNLPGTAVADSSVSADIKALFELAAQAYPTMFVGGSDWRQFSGYTFKFFSGSGIYVGIKDGQVNLLGGPFGNTITPKGSIAQVSSALQAYIANIGTTNPNPGGGSTADFGNLLVARTLNELAQTFSSITMEYGTIGAVSVIAQIKLDVIGPETVDGVATTRMKTTITGNGANNVYDMWLDSSGTFRKLTMGGFEYPSATAQFVGPGLVSGFLIALTAMDNAQVKAAIAGEIKNPALSSKVTQRPVGNTAVDTFELKVASGAASVTAYISDFGSFTMMTEYRAVLGSQTTYIEIIDMTLR